MPGLEPVHLRKLRTVYTLEEVQKIKYEMTATQPLSVASFEHRTNPVIIDLLEGEYHDEMLCFTIDVEIDQKLLLSGKISIRARIGNVNREQLVVEEGAVEFFSRISREVQKDTRIRELEGLLAMSAAQIYKQGTHTN